MRGMRLAVFTLTVLVLAGGLPVGAEDDRARPSRRATASEVRSLYEFVGRLSGTRRLRPGLTWASCGGPYSDSLRPARRRGDAQDDAAQAFDVLARRGPEAIPVLLAHLDDTTPTELKVHRLMSMSFGMEVEVDTENEDEVHRLNEVLREAPPAEIQEGMRTRRSTFFGGPSEHVVTVGDVCFAILGQITNRRYEAVRAQPTACVVVNSPTAEPRLARAVRALWGGVEARSELERRLRLDLERESPRHRAGAALRLALYYDVHSDADSR